MLAPDGIRAHLAARQPMSEFHVPGGVETLPVDPENAPKRLKRSKRLVDAVACQPALFNQREMERNAEEFALSQCDGHLCVGDLRRFA